LISATPKGIMYFSLGTSETEFAFER